METRVCTKCKQTKLLSDFSLSKVNCKVCRNADSRDRYARNKAEILAKRDPKKVHIANQEYYLVHREDILAQKREYNVHVKEARKIQRKAHYEANRERIIADISTYKKKNRPKVNARERKRRKNNPIYAIGETIRSVIKSSIKRNGGNKFRRSSLKYLSYTIEELCAHIEACFEPWMNWKNRGRYNSKMWKDNDSSTWTWQLDHIIPRSDLPYISMEEENFKKCWSLENLRPLSAKQNVIDGSARTRHKRGAK